jgi:hypothetical protein
MRFGKGGGDLMERRREDVNWGTGLRSGVTRRSEATESWGLKFESGTVHFVCSRFCRGESQEEKDFWVRYCNSKAIIMLFIK